MGIHVIQSQSLEVLLQGVMASITQPKFFSISGI